MMSHLKLPVLAVLAVNFISWFGVSQGFGFDRRNVSASNEILSQFAGNPPVKYRPHVVDILR